MSFFCVEQDFLLVGNISVFGAISLLMFRDVALI